jgi:hypothetical protein
MAYMSALKLLLGDLQHCSVHHQVLQLVIGHPQAHTNIVITCQQSVLEGETKLNVLAVPSTSHTPSMCISKLSVSKKDSTMEHAFSFLTILGCTSWQSMLGRHNRISATCRGCKSLPVSLRMQGVWGWILDVQKSLRQWRGQGNKAFGCWNLP